MITNSTSPHINMRPSFQECPHCHSINTEVDTTNIVMSNFPYQYNYHCKNCNEWFVSTEFLFLELDHRHTNEPTLATLESNYPTGWVCPKCGAVMSPTQSTCPFCSPTITPTITY